MLRFKPKNSSYCEMFYVYYLFTNYCMYWIHETVFNYFDQVWSSDTRLQHLSMSSPHLCWIPGRKVLRFRDEVLDFIITCGFWEVVAWFWWAAGPAWLWHTWTWPWDIPPPAPRDGGLKSPLQGLESEDDLPSQDLSPPLPHSLLWLPLDPSWHRNYSIWWPNCKTLTNL